MSEIEVYEPDAVPQSTALNLFGAAEPADVIERAEKVATALKRVVDRKQLTQKIGQGQHVKVEGWTLLGSMLGVFPVCVWTRKLEDGWEARVEARTRTGEVVGAAEAECLRSETNWKTRDDYALRSMAQTRATSKALRAPLGFVMTLAGYEVTPEAEMPPSGVVVSQDGITQAQQRKLGALLKEAEEKLPTAEGQHSWVDDIRARYGVQSRTQMSKAQASDAIDWLEKAIADAEIPFG